MRCPSATPATEIAANSAVIRHDKPMAEDPIQAIVDMVNRETDAWNRGDAVALVSVFHPDMVWPWPADPTSHDPVGWTTGMGRFNADRWRTSWQSLFDTHELVSNRREIVRVEVTPERDGGFAVVDVDTVWRRHSDGVEDQWLGRACKIYAKCVDGWKMTMQTGLLDFA